MKISDEKLALIIETALPKFDQPARNDELVITLGKELQEARKEITDLIRSIRCLECGNSAKMLCLECWGGNKALKYKAALKEIAVCHSSWDNECVEIARKALKDE